MIRQIMATFVTYDRQTITAYLTTDGDYALSVNGVEAPGRWPTTTEAYQQMAVLIAQWPA